MLYTIYIALGEKRARVVMKEHPKETCKEFKERVRTTCFPSCWPRLAIIKSGKAWADTILMHDLFDYMGSVYVVFSCTTPNDVRISAMCFSEMTDKGYVVDPCESVACQLNSLALEDVAETLVDQIKALSQYQILIFIGYTWLLLVKGWALDQHARCARC